MVDIIVPVYNGFDDVQKCFNSLKKYVDFNENRLVFINDKSPDERIEPLLESFKINENIIVINNEKNKGFSANVNIGMKLSEINDVILLNSDTIVTKNWVSKLYACAYSSKEIGTVTPLSNSATLCSYPIFCQDNKIPDGMDVDSLAELIERVSMHKYPRITVAVGFCMYIKRTVINEVGYFDAETFGRGYGEENDFCNRAEQLGYIHVMADDTFVYHKGTASFDTEEKIKLIRAHEKILNKRYPEQQKRNSEYCVLNPDQYIRDNITIYRKLENGRQTVLYLLHADFKEDSLERHGGTQYHVKDLTNYLKYSKNIIVAAREEKYLNVTIYIDDDIVKFRFDIGEIPLHQMFYSKKIYETLHHILVAFKVDLIHVHHIQRLSFDIFDLAHKLNIPLILTLHDFYMLCPEINFVDENGKYCGVKKSRDCDSCLSKQKIIAPTVKYIDNWRNKCYQALRKCNEIIVPSKSCKEYFEKFYPDLNINIIPHGIDVIDKNSISTIDINLFKKNNRKITYHIDSLLDKTKEINKISGWVVVQGIESSQYNMVIGIKDNISKLEDYYVTKKTGRQDIANIYESEKYLMSGFDACIPYEKYSGKSISISFYITTKKEKIAILVEKKVYIEKLFRDTKLKIAFVGGLSFIKGSRFSKKLIEESSSDVCWYQFGEIGDPQLKQLERNNYIKTGKYEREEIQKLLKGYNIDIVCILSCWPETFCYTLSEAFAAHIPVIGTNLGAVGDRIAESEAGWTVSSVNPVPEIQNIISSILNNPELLTQKKEKLNEIDFLTNHEMIKKYERIYSKYGMNHLVSFDADYEFIFKSSEFGFDNIRIQELINKVEALSSENDGLHYAINDILASRSFKAMQKVKSIIFNK